MKSRKQIIIMLVWLLLFAFATVMAQTPTQGDQKKKAEACCAMETCCCNDGSCSMKKEGDQKDASCGESCDMTKHEGKHDAKKHDSKDHKDCCKMKQKNKKAA